MLKVAGLFSGIGGLELGLERAGHITRMLCEKDPVAQLVLRDRFPRVSLRSDVADIDELPSGIQLLAAGFPCQDLSQVGTTAGLKGTKSSIVEHVFRLLRARPVDWVLLENVPFMLHLHGGAAIKSVLGRLRALGYDWAYRLVDTRAFGLPQRRERLFILASNRHNPADVLLGDDEGELKTADEDVAACGFYWTEGNRGIGWGVDCVPPLKGGSGLGIPSAPGVLDADGRLVAPDIRDAERLQGFPVGWTAAANAEFARQRWRLVGNAVSVPIATWIGRRLIRPSKWKPRTPGFMNGRWPRAAWNEGAKVRVADVSPWPRSFKYESLASFLKFSKQPLSVRAASGFLARLEASTLNVPKRLRRALRAHVSATKA